MRVVRILGTLEPGGAQLSALWLSAALRAQGIATTLLVGDATPAGLELAARYAHRRPPAGSAGSCPPTACSGRLRPGSRTGSSPGSPARPGARPHVRGLVGGGTGATAARTAGGQRAQPDVLATPRPHTASPGRGTTGRHVLRPGRAARAWAARIGLDNGRLRDGRSSVEGMSAGPLPGLPAPRLTFAGGLRGDKAPDLLVEALALLPAPPPAYLVGDGPPARRPDPAGAPAARGLEGVVRLPGWSYEPGRYIAGASVHAVPSREESWSQSAVLALGLGVPVVGTAVDGLARTLGEGRGVLVPPEDPPALAGALSRVLGGERPDPVPGRAYARQFTPGAAAAVYADAYRQLLTSRARSGKPGPAPP